MGARDAVSQPRNLTTALLVIGQIGALPPGRRRPDWKPNLSPPVYGSPGPAEPAVIDRPPFGSVGVGYGMSGTQQLPTGFVLVGGPVMTESMIVSPRRALDIQTSQNAGSRPFREVNHKSPPRGDGGEPPGST